MRQALRSRTQELESLKSDWSSHTALLTTQHSSSLNVEREKALQTQTQAQTCFEQEKKDLVQAHLERVRERGGVSYRSFGLGWGINEAQD